MYLGEPTNKRRRTIIGGIIAALVLFYLIGFWREIRDVILMLAQFPDGFFPERIESAKILIYTVFTFLLFAIFWIIAISQQALLPAITPQERWRTAFQFITYILGQHGPAVFVKDGKVLSTKEDVRDGPGVAVVDFNSAVVLEERLPPPGLGSGFDSGFHRFLWQLGLADKAESPRVMGPGIVFTRSRERIRGAVDLRRQFRMLKDISGYSRDGIEVGANVWSIFTIGQDPDILQVTYEGEKHPDNLRVINFEPLPDGYLRVAGFSDELDRLDRQEIHHYFHVLSRTQDFQEYSALPPPSALPVFNKERVFNAVYSEARAEDEEVVKWTELPTRLGASIFREIISQASYDQLYQVGNPGPLPLTRFRGRLRQTMRNYGLLSYRMIFLKNGEPFQLRRVYREGEMKVSKTHALVASKILRDRGIKVIASGFGDILPVSEAVYRHRLDSWKAPWQRDQLMVNATSELEVMRIRARARALAQQDLAANLSTIMAATSNPEVLAVRLMQALEQVGADARTMQLLPPNTIDLMRSVHDFLSHGESETTSPGQLMPPTGGLP